MAQQIKVGLESNPNIVANIYQVPETLTQDVLDKMHAPAKSANIPEATLDHLTDADGLLFGIPTRYGQASAQMKAFWDRTGQLWMS
jgi:NAD(P)H dehydrogenase (quinone)